MTKTNKPEQLTPLLHQGALQQIQIISEQQEEVIPPAILIQGAIQEGQITTEDQPIADLQLQAALTVPVQVQVVTPATEATQEIQVVTIKAEVITVKHLHPHPVEAQAEVVTPQAAQTVAIVGHEAPTQAAVSVDQEALVQAAVADQGEVVDHDVNA